VASRTTLDEVSEVNEISVDIIDKNRVNILSDGHDTAQSFTKTESFVVCG
jgi:hypothetical protein